MERPDASPGLHHNAALCGALAGGFFSLSVSWRWVHRLMTAQPTPSEAVVFVVQVAACIFAGAFLGTVVASFARSVIIERRLRDDR